MVNLGHPLFFKNSHMSGFTLWSFGGNIKDSLISTTKIFSISTSNNSSLLVNRIFIKFTFDIINYFKNYDIIVKYPTTHLKNHRFIHKLQVLLVLTKYCM